MASNPLFIIPDFFLHFPKKLISFRKCKEKPGIPFGGGHHAFLPQKPVVKIFIKTLKSVVRFNVRKTLSLRGLAVILALLIGGHLSIYASSVINKTQF